MTARRLSLDQILTQCAEFEIKFAADAGGDLFLACELMFDIEQCLPDELFGAIIRNQNELIKTARLLSADQLERAIAEPFNPRAPEPAGQFKHDSQFRLNCGELRAMCDDVGIIFAKDGDILCVGLDYAVDAGADEVDGALSDRIFGAIVRNRLALMKIAKPLYEQNRSIDRDCHSTNIGLRNE
ncbi:MAG: hypothetical protein ACYDB9_02060 [Gammaproteobacteria bacterium]